MKKIATAAVFLSALLWGTMGVFVRELSQFGLSTNNVAFVRLLSASIILVIVLFIKDRKGFYIDLKDLPLFMVTGSVSVFAMCAFYYKSIELSSMSVAAILLYTSPFYVTVAAAFFYKEKITVTKVCALIVAFIGCIFVAGLGGKVSGLGVLFGLLSGITYASYSIFSKKLLEKYSSLTVTTWCFIFAAIASACLSNPAAVFTTLNNSGYTSLLLSVLAGLITAVLPFTLYTFGLKHIEAGSASVMATLEPMTATILGTIIYKEFPNALGVLGIVLILFAIILLNKKSRV